ncbi:hypothetical protein [Cylindrospermopsis raciborskii]|uniref:hypothetical protein n=1 Tax=Cylindrospermopsis raciborskii TaxID=77022 RepID=UPI00117838D5|nr:hypothetical protein [Cylindrospermopsis raciborskii]
MKTWGGAIARSKRFPNKLRCIFSREWGRLKRRSQFWRMKMFGGAIAHSEWFPNKLPRFFSREICECG